MTESTLIKVTYFQKRIYLQKAWIIDSFRQQRNGLLACLYKYKWSYTGAREKTRLCQGSVWGGQEVGWALCKTQSFDEFTMPEWTVMMFGTRIGFRKWILLSGIDYFSKDRFLPREDRLLSKGSILVTIIDFPNSILAQTPYESFQCYQKGLIPDFLISFCFENRSFWQE